MLKSRLLVRRFVVCSLSAFTWLLLLLRPAAAQPLAPASPQINQPGYVAQILTPAWRATFPYRPAFGSLCSLAPLSCALIDRPFALNAHLDLIIRPQAADGSTGALLPFGVSVPLFGRAELGLGSCYAWFWEGPPAPAQGGGSPSGNYPSGLCPFYIAGKLLLFPWFADPHQHPALALEYLFEYQAGPFSGLNQLGLPGPMSKVSLAYRHPLSGGLELGAALSVLVDHTSHAGTVQLGPQISYHLPIVESFWAFAQAVVQAPSWGPLVPSVVAGQMVNLAPAFSGAFVVGLQQRSNAGVGVGVSLSVAKSTVDTSVSLNLRIPNIEISPNNKPWFTPKEKKAEPAPAVVTVTQPPPAELVCPPGMQPAPATQPPMPPGSPQPDGTLPAAPPPPTCVPIPPPVSPLWGHPCYLAPLDGGPEMRMGTIDSTGEYCEWDGLRLPLGAVISPPERVPRSERSTPESPNAASPSPAQNAAPTVPTAQAVPGKPGVHPHKAPAAPHTKALAGIPTPPPGPLPAQRPSPPVEHPKGPAPPPPRPQTVPGSAFASGFADRARDTYKHGRELYRAVKEHGVSVVLPSPQEAEAWLRKVKAQCLDQFEECLEDKAGEAALALNNFAQKPWEEKKYVAGGWAFDTLVNTAVTVAIPGGGVAAKTAEKIAEGAAEKAIADALARKAAEEALEAEARRVATEQAARAAAEAEARRRAEEQAAREAKARLEQEARERAEREAKERAEKEAKERAAKEAEQGTPGDGTRSSTDFVVTEDGTAVPVSQDRMRDGFERAEFPKTPRSPDKPEPGMIHTVPTKHGPVDVRTMEGGAYHDRRAVFTRSGSNQPVKVGGAPIKGNLPKKVQQDLSHLPQKE